VAAVHAVARQRRATDLRSSDPGGVADYAVGHKQGMILGQYIQGNLWCAVAWTWPWPVLLCPCDADAAAPTLPSTRARTRIPRFTQMRTVPVAGAWGALPTDPLVRMMTCENDL
jgi:hypothetical protein